jgi:hypothetical protein
MFNLIVSGIFFVFAIRDIWLYNYWVAFIELLVCSAVLEIYLIKKRYK